MEKEYKIEIAKEIRRIMEMEGNKEAAGKFMETLSNIKPKSCIVKIGWRSGEEISILLVYEKGGNKIPFDLFIENIENKAEIYSFICGLYPEIFHFNPKFAIEDKTHFFVDFKLKRNG